MKQCSMAGWWGSARYLPIILCSVSLTHLLYLQIPLCYSTHYRTLIEWFVSPTPGGTILCFSFPWSSLLSVTDFSKENTVLRGKLDPRKVFTIPNAIETRFFYPDPEQFYGNPTTIIFLGRLVYRKGADLLCAIIPKVRFPFCLQIL